MPSRNPRPCRPGAPLDERAVDPSGGTDRIDNARCATIAADVPTRPRRALRVLAIDDFPHAELVEHDVRAIFTVEPM